jgi:hypothetical protein
VYVVHDGYLKFLIFIFPAATEMFLLSLRDTHFPYKTLHFATISYKNRKNKKIIMKSENSEISEKLIIVQTGSANIKTLNINYNSLKRGNLNLNTPKLTKLSFFQRQIRISEPGAFNYVYE